MKKKRTYSKPALEVTILLGEQIKLARKQRKWNEQTLADRAGISRTTLQKIEKGDMTCAIGLVFEVASLVGVNLFEQDKRSLTSQIEQTRDKVALLPQKIKLKRKIVKDDF